MKRVLLKMKAAGVAVLLAGGIIGYSLAPAGASTLDGLQAAKATSAQSLAAIGGPPANFENAGDWATCLDANSNGYPNSGDKIQLWACNTHPEQEWTLTSSGQLQNAGTSMCLDANSNHYPNSGDTVQLWACNTHPEQEWTLTSSGQLQSTGTSMCLDANSNDYPNSGDTVQLWSCNTHPEQEWRLDWAASSFCASHFNQPYMGTTFDGVAACGVKYDGTSSNNQGKITYNNVPLDSDGFQCVELAARYFYYVTGHNPPSANGGSFAWAVHSAYPQYGISPGGANGGVSSYLGTLVAGDIISMWSSTNLIGHVAVVTSIALNSAQTGKIYVIDENASATGSDAITVTNGKMTFNGLNDFQWVYNLP
jgi:Ricin-type beta-trefoil lectin domain/CHAP domain